MESSASQSRAPIVAAFAPGPAAHEPIEFGLAASRITGAPLVIVSVDHGVPLMNDVVYEHDDQISQLRKELVRRGIHDPDIRVFDDSSAARGLAQAMDEISPELIVLGASRRGTPRTLGTTAQRVIHASSCPVAIVPLGYRRPEGGIRLIGAAYTVTDEGREALHAAIALARAASVRVLAITVLDPKHAAQQSHGMLAEQHHDVSPSERQAARGRLDAESELAAVVAELGAGVDVETDVLFNEAAEGLLAASRHVDMLIMGSRALGPKRAVLLGSVSRKVIAAATCPVLVLPRGADAKTDALLADAQTQAARGT
ncbi:universal stress protein [Solirubrobacter ginsenosidimutans]|uniref:Universal stress protein n=1 Tax=Solirubrobacter ginsenosidimutans TaxID=490573 RepID=A0A9X3MSN6_9ACTN|nr:universal stress protein [Solirubrobacter ginsenosidimutans]MDA0158933.1 universal stress protein [Solirubrobacter ginsenosidimutans]